MTPADLLAPQPPTVPGDDARPVWGLILADIHADRYSPGLDTGGLKAVLLELCVRRDDFGATKYGVRLPVDSERDPRKDELQEAMDGLAYSRQTYEQELSASCDLWHGLEQARRHRLLADRAWARHLRCLQTVLELLEELGA